MDHYEQENRIKFYEKYWIVTVVDSISATSMPVNEFVIYRVKKGYECRQSVLVYDGRIPENVKVPSNVDFKLIIDKRIREIRKFIDKAERTAKAEGVNVIYHLHHQKSALLFYRASFGMGIRKKILFTVHSTYQDRDFKYKLSSALCVLMADRANCVSQSAFWDYSLLIRKIKGKKFTVILNGTDFARVKESEKQTKKEDICIKRKRLICVGRMIPIKNHVFLLELLKQLTDYELVLVGEEDKEKKIRRFVNENGLNDRVIFTGLLERDRVFQWLFRCGIYVSASMVEGMPVSVLEAMSAGLIPVLSDIRPHREIKKECNEICVLPMDVQVWVTEINRIASLTMAEFNEISNKCKNSTRKVYSLDAMHKKYFELYDSMCR